LAADPGVYLGIQDVEGKRAVSEHFIVAVADVKLVAKFLPRFFPQFNDLQLSQLVSQGLTGPRDVAVDFALNVRLIHRGVAMEVVNHLLSGPMLLMHPGVDNQADRPPHLVFQTSVIAVGILIVSNFFSQTLCVKRPAFDEGRVTCVASELRQILHLLRQRELEMVAGNPFMVGDRFDVQNQAAFGIPLIDIDVTGTRTVRSAVRIIRRHRVLGARGFHGDHCQLALG
jgi:hypothetical protein